MKKELQDLRETYIKGDLLENAINADPIEQFKNWFKAYKDANNKDANAFILATADNKGHVSSRVLLLKGIDKGGFEFYSNYNSNKGKQIAANPKVSLTFYWPELERQVRVEGTVEKLSEQESTTYFKSRPYESQIGAWTSPQSEIIEGRSVLTKREKEYKEKYPNQVPKPKNWGGYRVLPSYIEFWQGRPSRLHDRLVYTKKGEQWKTTRLAP